MCLRASSPRRSRIFRSTLVPGRIPCRTFRPIFAIDSDPAATTLIETGRIGAVVYAGSEKSALAGFNDLIRIPSLYEQWGIMKFFRPSTSDLVYVIPPIKQYAEHYGAMLSWAHPKSLPLLQ